MPIIGHTRKAGARAPQRITGINWSSPLAAKLVMALPLVGNVAQRYFSSRGDGLLTVTDATRAPIASVQGLGYNFDGAGSDAIDDGGAFAHQSGATSISAWMRSTDVSTTRGVFENSGNATDATANYAGLFITHGFAGTTNPSLPHAWQGNNTGTGSGNRGTRAAGSTVGANVTALVAATTKTGSTFPDVYLNGQLSNGSTSGGGSPGGPRSGGYVRAGNVFNGSNTNADPYAGSVWNCAIFQPELSAEEHAWLYRAPWDMYAQSTRTYFIPAAAGGPTTHTITPSGGITFAGSGVYQYARKHDVSGGVQLAGSAALKATRIHDVSGGVQFAGTSTFNVSRDIVPDGGVQLGGSATQTNVRVHDVSGGLSFSGAAGMQATRVLSPSGGLSLGGTGNFTGVEAGLTIVPSGGIQFGGGASGTLWPDNLAYGGFAHRVARKVADDVADDVTDFHRRYDD